MCVEIRDVVLPGQPGGRLTAPQRLNAVGSEDATRRMLEMYMAGHHTALCRLIIEQMDFLAVRLTPSYFTRVLSKND